jgi:hypothetical protein
LDAALEQYRLIDYAPHGHWKMMTFVGALRQRGMTVPFVLEGLRPRLVNDNLAMSISFHFFHDSACE